MIIRNVTDIVLEIIVIRPRDADETVDVTNDGRDFCDI